MKYKYVKRMKKADYKYVIPQLSNSVKSGIYFISQQDIGKNTSKVMTVKIGRSTDLKRRLNQYHLCYPLGFHVYGLMYVHTKNRPKNGLITHNIDTEMEVHSYFKDKQLKTTARSYNEWFEINYADILQCMTHFRHKFDVTRPFRGSSSVVDSFVDDISGEKIGKQAMQDNEALKDYLKGLDADLLSELLHDPDKLDALQEWSGGDVDRKMSKILSDDKKEVHKVEIRDEKKIRCSDCQYEKFESRFVEGGKQFKTCNQCRNKRKNRRINRVKK